MAETKERLLREFPPVSVQTWTEKIVSDLKGASFEKKMVWKTDEGIDVNPFYTADDLERMAPLMRSLPGEFPYIRGTKINNSWFVRQEIDVSDCKAANEKAKRLITVCGVTSLGFQLSGEQINKENIEWLLDGISPETTELNFKACNRKAVTLINILADYFKSVQADLSQCNGSIAYDPFKKPLIKGVTLEREWIDEAVAVVQAGESLPGFRVLAVNACYLNNAGASITQELGYALAWGNELIDNLSDEGIAVEKIARKIKFNFGISSHYFLEIAKFRAARWLWAALVKAWRPSCDCGCAEGNHDACCVCACKMKIHARTSEWNMTVYDAYVNLLRTQTETMSAALAGVDSITVLPYDYAFRQPDEFSERLARNQQLLLQEECHFDKTVDPAAGSYYIEVLTQSLADTAWKLFLEIDNSGGFADHANKGDIQRAVNETNDARHNRVATRRHILIGVNQYPDFTERASQCEHSEAIGEDFAKRTSHGEGSETIRDGSCNCTAGVITKLDFSRGASGFEALRLAVEKSERVESCQKKTEN